MKIVKSDYFSFFLILIISFLFVLEFFLFPGRPATFDAVLHISSIAQFSKIIGQGEFPVIWMNNFANYGLPIGLFTHQLTNYLGSLIVFFTHDPTTSYNMLTFIALFLSNIFLYLFLRIYFSPLACVLGIFIFSFTPYRIFNIYVRGAMPEVFSGIFLPLILAALYLIVVKRKTYVLFLLTLLITGLTLAHPMMLVVYSFLLLPYLIFLLITSESPTAFKVKIFIISGIFMLLGVLICSYFVIPLTIEIKYFYFGLEKSHLAKGSYLSLMDYMNPQWSYLTTTEIFTRGHKVLFGVVETVILLSGFLYVLYKKVLNKSKENTKILYFALISSLLIIFFMTGLADIFFQKIFFLNSIQFPWRLLSSLIFLPPVVAAFLYDRYPKKIIVAAVVLIVAFFSFPQIYGKNYNVYPVQSYFFSKDNAHSVLMNTIWTGKSEDYPDKNKQGEIIEGKGVIVHQTLKNSSRIYQINASTPVKMVDRTFYFPGWAVYVDNVKTNIEFQNPDYRGVITYNVPAGKHSVSVIFEDTKIRSLGKILSVISLVILIVLLSFGKRIGGWMNIFGPGFLTRKT